MNERHDSGLARDGTWWVWNSRKTWSASAISFQALESVRPSSKRSLGINPT